MSSRTSTYSFRVNNYAKVVVIADGSAPPSLGGSGWSSCTSPIKYDLYNVRTTQYSMTWCRQRNHIPTGTTISVGGSNDKTIAFVVRAPPPLP